MRTELNVTNARAFNASLKKAVIDLIGQKVNVEIVNSYKFPNCWVRIHSSDKFSNDFKSMVFDACKFDRKGLLHPDNISYGNIQTTSIAAHVAEWVYLFHNQLTEAQ